MRMFYQPAVAAMTAIGVLNAKTLHLQCPPLIVQVGALFYLSLTSSTCNFQGFAARHRVNTSSCSAELCRPTSLSFCRQEQRWRRPP